MEPEVLTEVPESLKRLIRLVVRGFYSIEHAIVIDLLVRNPCMKEDDIIELLKYDRKQLRSYINTLKSEKFLKFRMRVETDTEGKMTRHNYYFINYLMFVNVVKYKLDHVRRKIEMEERDNTSRASFKCPGCEKTFTDLEVDQLFDLSTQKFICTYCSEEVVEDESAVMQKDARTLLAKFNEQIEPIYVLLRECDGISLSQDILEPEPTDLKHTTRSKQKSSAQGDKTTWSGDATRDRDFGMSESTVTITVDEEKKKEAVRERPVWMTESTVDGASNDTNEFGVPKSDIAGPSRADTSRNVTSNEIETLLIIHEKKSGAVPGIPADDSSSSDSEDEKKPTASAAVEEMEDDDDEEGPMVSIGGAKVSIHDVTDDMVAKMTPHEKEEYIRLGQEMYQDMYE